MYEEKNVSPCGRPVNRRGPGVLGMGVWSVLSMGSVHIVEPETGRMRHGFTVRAEGGRVTPDVQLLITEKQRGLTGTVSVTAAGAAPLAVPVSGE